MRKENSVHKQSKKAGMCFKTRRASTRDYTVCSIYNAHTFLLEISINPNCKKYKLFLDWPSYCTSFGSLILLCPNRHILWCFVNAQNRESESCHSLHNHATLSMMYKHGNQDIILIEIDTTFIHIMNIQRLSIVFKSKSVVINIYRGYCLCQGQKFLN